MLNWLDSPLSTHGTHQGYIQQWLRRRRRVDGYVVQRQRDVRLGNWENIDLVYGWEVLGLSAVVVHSNG